MKIRSRDSLFKEVTVFKEATTISRFRPPGQEVVQGAAKEVGKRSSITFFRFRHSFGHFLVTFSDASVTFFVTLCQTPFAAG